MSPGKDETRVCGYIYIYIYIYKTRQCQFIDIIILHVLQKKKSLEISRYLKYHTYYQQNYSIEKNDGFLQLNKCMNIYEYIYKYINI